MRAPPTDTARRVRGATALVLLAGLLLGPACSDAPDEGIPREPFSEDQR
ncbi:MAG: hypothetical protein M3N68_14415 [Actinomycetota bacterium]|nr:hypothetical protein [Actinomycetota bacterium]